MNADNIKTRKNVIILILIIIILLLLYFLVRKFGYIDNRDALIPTGNVDIFEIDCNCVDCQKSIEPIEENDINKHKNNNDQNSYGDETSQNESEESSDSFDENNSGGITVFDNYKIWNNKELRIFSNPAYEYESKIAPGSENSYTFVIRNNNNFDVVVDISFIEENEKNINMNYKLRSEGKYLFGNETNYDKFNNFKVEGVIIPAKSQIPYLLDWKWVDSSNDTEIGFDNNSVYKLSIQIGANY